MSPGSNKLATLVAKYPEVYAQDFYFQCNDGWFKIVDELSAKLAKLGVQVVQVKEKFGGLRVYLDVTAPGAYELIHEAEQKSFVTCEFCGEPGKLGKSGYWQSTLCDKHREEENKRRART